jgi:hypothetical protein
MSSVKDKWIETQTKTYVKWLNAHLPTSEAITTLPDDFRDGVAMTTAICHLFALPEPRGLVRDARRLESRILRLQNVHLSLKLLDQVGIHTHLSADAVVDGKSVLVLGLVWRLIVAAQLRPALKKSHSNASVESFNVVSAKNKSNVLKKKDRLARRSGPMVLAASLPVANDDDNSASTVFATSSTLFVPTSGLVALGAKLDASDSEYGICDDEKESAAATGRVDLADAATRSARDALLVWCADKAGLVVRNFASDWATARPFVALIEALAPAQWRWHDRESLAEAFRAAKDVLGIAPLLDVADLMDPLGIDERSVMTYVSEFVIKHRERSNKLAAGSTLFREQSTTKTHDSDDDDDDVNDNDAAKTIAKTQRRDDLQYPVDDDDDDDDDDNDGEELRVPPAPHARTQVTPDEYDAHVRSHHRAYAERSRDNAVNAAAPAEAGYGVSGGVLPAASTPPRASRLVNPKYLVSPEEADAAGYGVTPAVAPNQIGDGQVEYLDTQQHYVDYNDDDDNDVPESPRKQKGGGGGRLVSVQPNVPLDSDTLRRGSAHIKPAKPTTRLSGIVPRRPIVGSLRNNQSTASMSSTQAPDDDQSTATATTDQHRRRASVPATMSVTVAAVTGKMQPQVTSMSFQGDDLVHVERYRDGKLVTGNEPPSSKQKKKDKKAGMPNVNVSVRNTTITSGSSNNRTSSSSSSKRTAVVPLEGNDQPLLACKCPNCFQKNKYHPGTDRLMCYSCRTTFRLPKQ